MFGASVGTGVGAAAGIVQAISASRGRRVPAVVAIPLIGGAAAAVPAISMMVLGISDPREWTLDDWVSDLVPHLAYGAATFAVLRIT